MAAVSASSLRDNPDILNLLNLLSAHEYQSQRQEFASMLGYFDILANHYNSLVAQIAELNEKVSDLSERKNPFAIMLEHMKNIVSGIGEKLQAIKDNIVDFSKNVFETAKNKSLSAAGAAAGALHIGEGLQAVSETLNRAAGKFENLELFHMECVESKLLAKLEIPSDLELLSQDELKTVYAKILDIGMDDDLSSGENAFLQDMTEEIESMLPERGNFEKPQEQAQEAEAEQGI